MKKYERIQSIKTGDNNHPFLLAYSRMVDRLMIMYRVGKLEYDSGCNWARWTDPKTKKGVQVSDRTRFPGDDIIYNVSISFYQFK